MTALASPPKYHCIVADPPWMERGGGKIKRGADRHYKLMSPAAILRAMLSAECFRPADDCHLWLFVTDNHLKDGLMVMECLGFRYIRTAVWCKTRIGLGQYLRGQHELCLFGVQGRQRALVRNVPSVFGGGPVDHMRDDRGKIIHSGKPDAAYEAIERVSPGPRLEMFGRRARAGWDVWGDEAPPVRPCLESIEEGSLC